MNGLRDGIVVLLLPPGKPEVADSMSDSDRPDDSWYTVEQRDDLMIVRVERFLDLREAIAVIDEFSSRDLPEKRLWVFGGYVKLSNPDTLRELGELARAKLRQPGRVAYVVEDAVDFGLTNVLAAPRHLSGFEYGIFRDEGEAIAWLNAEEGD